MCPKPNAGLFSLNPVFLQTRVCLRALHSPYTSWRSSSSSMSFLLASLYPTDHCIWRYYLLSISRSSSLLFITTSWGQITIRFCSDSHYSSFLTAAAAAKSLQSCPTLCDPIDGSPPGFPIPGILQARTLEWGAISFLTSVHPPFLLLPTYCPLWCQVEL